MSLSKLTKLMETRGVEFTTSFGGFVKDYRKYRESDTNLTIITLNEFMKMYCDEIDCGCEHFIKKKGVNKSDYEIYLLVDISEERVHTMNRDMRKKYRKCGQQRRWKLDMKYHYEANIFNRIHAYAMIEKSPGLSDDKTLAINVICSSNYSHIKGIGSYMMKSLIESAKTSGYENIVLEVGSDQIEDQSDEESDEETDEETDEESDTEDLEDIKIELCAYITGYLWKKSVRHNNGIPYYSFGEGYLETIISDYIDNEPSEPNIPEITDDEEYGYGGYYYNKSN